MGAEQFAVKSQGATAEQAFRAAVANARAHYGAGGYTGTIAEKRSFIEVVLPAGLTPGAFLDALERERKPAQMSDRDWTAAFRTYDDKWGAAVCVALGNGHWLFAGLASS
jgi:hypothetical protein